MGDILVLFGDAFSQNILLFTTIVFAAFAVVPWVGLILLNAFNKNVWKEIKTTFKRGTVRLIYVLQNGQLQILYRNMNSDKSITLTRDKKTGVDDKILPTTAPHPDSDSFKQNYICVQGQEGTLNLLEKTKFDVNSPQKKMGFSMSFEAGRDFERYSMEPKMGINLQALATVGIPVVMLIFVLIMIYAQNTTLEAIAEAVGAVLK